MNRLLSVMVSVLFLGAWAPLSAQAMGKPKLGDMAGYYRLSGPCTGAEWDVNEPSKKTALPRAFVPLNQQGRGAMDPALQEFRLEQDTPDSIAISYRAPTGAIQRTVLLSSPGRKVHAGGGRLSLDDERKQGGGILSWTEFSRFDAQLKGGRLTARWQVSESAYQMRQTCIFEPVLPAPAPIEPPVDENFQCKATLQESVPYQVRVGLGESWPAQEIYRKVLSPGASGGEVIEVAGRWFNTSWQQNGQGPFYGEIDLDASKVTLWHEDFEMRDPASGQAAGPAPAATVASTDGTAARAYEVEVGAHVASNSWAVTGLRLSAGAAGPLAQADVIISQGDRTTADGTVGISLAPYSTAAEIEGHTLATGGMVPSAVLQVHCSKPSARP